MKKSIFFITFLICVALLSSACSQDIARPGQDSVNSAEGAEDNKVDPGISEEVNLSLWIGYPEFDGWLDNVSKAYMEKHPNVKIEATSYNLRDVETKISTALPAGSGPDIVSIDPTFFLRFIQGGYARKAPQEVIDFVKSDSFDRFLTEQHDDIIKSMDSLNNIIVDMDRTIKAKFRESFDMVVINFLSIFHLNGFEGLITLLLAQLFLICK